MANPSDGVAIETMNLLDVRLKRIEYVVKGRVDSEIPPNTEASVYERLQSLEHVLFQLSSKSRVIHDLLRLCELRNYTPSLHGLIPNRCQIPGSVPIPGVR